MTNWPVPSSVSEVRSFLGLATYFRRFIQGFSALARPLHRLTQKDMVNLPKMPWDAACQNAFEALKVALTTAPVLAMPDHDKPFEVWSDASVHGVGAVLIQDGRPVYFESRKFSPAEYNYDTGEQEMAAVVHALAVFRCYLGRRRFVLVTDHEPLVYFQSKPVMSRKHARWYEFLQSFNFEWQYRAGKGNVADPLSRLPEAVVAQPSKHFLLAIRGPQDDFLSAVRKHWPKNLEGDLSGNPNFWAEVADRNGLTQHEGLWWKGDRLVIPFADGKFISHCLKAVHNSPFGGHFGQKKSLELARRLYWWPAMEDDVVKHVRECAKCQRNKASNLAPQGELEPPELAAGLWESISIDFIVKLPATRRGHDSILVVVDRFSKYVKFKACSESLTATGLTRLLEELVVADHGFPQQVWSDRDVRVTARVFQTWCAKHGIRSELTTAYHSRANGQAERFNLTLENYLRSFVDGDMTNWDLLLPVAQLAMNNSYHHSTNTTPFFLNYGRHPWLPGVTYKRAGLSNTGGEATDQQVQRVQHRLQWTVDRRVALQNARLSLKEAQCRMKRSA